MTDNGTTAKVVGLVRDLLFAGLGLAILFGLDISNDQVAGILAIVAPFVALIVYVLSSVKSPKGKV